LGKEIFKNACNKIGLTDETDYFGLRFLNKKDAEVSLHKKLDKNALLFMNLLFAYNGLTF
jgi:hypothetical protein